MSSKPELYSYFRSSCSWRVRAALLYKNIDYEYRAVSVKPGDDQQFTDEFMRLNPRDMIPVLLIDGEVLTESMAILEYLEETRPDSGKGHILPKDPKLRAKAREICMIIISGIQPMQNLRVLDELPNEVDKGQWARTCIEKGFDALEKVLAKTAGKYAVGDTITMADFCIPPQVYNAKRFDVDMSKYPTIARLDHTLLQLDEFKLSHPNHQPDCSEQGKTNW